MKLNINTKRYFQVLGITLVVLFLVVMGFWIYDFVTTAHLSADEGLTDEEIATVEVMGGKVNVLVMGVDKDGLRTDAIMLVSYDMENHQVKALSIPRDTRMYIGSKYQKINAAHAIGSSKGKPIGPQGTVEAVSRLTNVPINYYVDFTFEGIANCIDAMGPVTFEIPDLNNDGVGMVYDDPEQDLHINLKPGLQELNGEQCVHLLRYRKGNKINGVRRTYANGDIDRIKVQQDFVKALVDQKLNSSLITKIPDIFEQVSNEMRTNLTVAEVIKYSKGLDQVKSENIQIFSLPGNFSGDEYDASYWICDLDATRELIETEFGYDASKITVDKEYGASSDSGKKSGDTKTTSTTAKPSSDGDKSNTTQKPQTSQKTDEDTKQTKKPYKPEIKNEDEDITVADGDEKPKTTAKPTQSVKPMRTQSTGESDDEKKDEEQPASTPKATPTPKATKQPATIPQKEED